MNTTQEVPTKSGRHIFVQGYIEDRIALGEIRKYAYPHSPLPDLPDAKFPDLEPSFVTAQGLKHQK